MRYAFLSLLAALAIALPASAQTAAPVELRILAINDFHGNLRPPPGGIRIGDPEDKSQEGDGRGRRRGVHGDAGQAAARGAHEHDLRCRRRPDRREPVPVGDVSRRALGRGALDDGACDHLGRQSRVRRGQDRALADAERRLSSGRRLPGAASLHRRQVPLSRGFHHRDRDRQERTAALRDQGVRGHPRRLHRTDLEGDRGHRLALRHCRARIPRRGRDGERAGAAAEGARRRGDRGADPPGR